MFPAFENNGGANPKSALARLREGERERAIERGRKGALVFVPNQPSVSLPSKPPQLLEPLPLPGLLSLPGPLLLVEPLLDRARDSIPVDDRREGGEGGREGDGGAEAGLERRVGGGGGGHGVGGGVGDEEKRKRRGFDTMMATKLEKSRSCSSKREPLVSSSRERPPARGVLRSSKCSSWRL